MIDLTQDVYSLKRKNEHLQREVEHYKKKAQDWKTSSLMHQKKNKLLQTEGGKDLIAAKTKSAVSVPGLPHKKDAAICPGETPAVAGQRSAIVVSCILFN